METWLLDGGFRHVFVPALLGMIVRIEPTDPHMLGFVTGG